MAGRFAERRYSDDELRRIFEEAARESDAAVAATAGGYTLEEIREIGREVGIAPEQIDRAAANVDAAGSPDGTPSSATRFATVLHEERELGWRITDGDMHMIVSQAEQVIGRAGNIRVTGDWAEWRDHKGRLYIGVVRGEDRTRARVIADQTGDLIAGTAVIAVLAALLVTSGASSAGVFAPALLLIPAAAIGAIGFWVRWRTNVMRGHMRELLDVLVGGEPRRP